MDRSGKYYIDIFKLKNGSHDYSFLIDNDFFIHQEYPFTRKGEAKLELTIEKSESLIIADTKILGSIELICDRTLDNFMYPIDLDKRIIFKYGLEYAELDDDVVVIKKDTQRIIFDKFIYEYFRLAIPMKKLHPRFDNESNTDELVYTDNNKNSSISKNIDPRWKKLKNIG